MGNQWKQKQNSNPAGQNGRLICIYLFLILLSFPHAAAQSSNQAPPAYPLAFGYYYFNSSFYVILIIILCAFLLLFFVSVCLHRRYRIEDDASVQVNSIQSQTPRRRCRGLDPAVIEGFPTFAYLHVKDHKLGSGELECAVCLNEFEDDDKIRLLPKCDHVFHAECIDAWLSKHTTCPVCRADLVPAPGETPVITEPVQDIEGDFDGENPRPEEEDVENEQVSINLISDEPEVVAVAAPDEVINQAPLHNRPVRLMKPGFLGRFPRSHSTGHSLVQPGEDLQRFTLRRPDDVRKQIMNMRQLNRTS